MAPANKIVFGDYLKVIDQGSGVIRVDGCPPGGMNEWEDVGTSAGGGTGGVSGIQFDKYPQNGGFLFTETSADTDITTVGDNADLRLTTDAPTTHGTILLQTQQKGDIHLDVEDGFLHLESEGEDGVKLAATIGDVTILSGPAGGTGLGGGDIILSIGQWLILAGIPANTDPGVNSAVWADHGVLRISGYT